MAVFTEEDISSLMRFLQATLKYNHTLVEKTNQVVREEAGFFTQSPDEHTM